MPGNLKRTYASAALAAAMLVLPAAGAQAKTCWPYGTVTATAGIAIKLGPCREPELQLPEEARDLALQRGGHALPALIVAPHAGKEKPDRCSRSGDA